jgi:hypothetical protein
LCGGGGGGGGGGVVAVCAGGDGNNGGRVRNHTVILGSVGEVRGVVDGVRWSGCGLVNVISRERAEVV